MHDEQKSAPAATVEAYHHVVDALPFPVLVADPEAADWPVLLANPAMHRLVGGDPVGQPLDDVLGLRLLGEEGGDPTDLLDAARRAAGGVSGHRAEVRGVLRTRWWVTLEPLGDPAWGVMLTFVDDLGEGWSGTRRHRRDVLHDLGAVVAGRQDLAELLDEAVQRLVETAGARRGALLFGGPDGHFRMAAGVASSERAVQEWSAGRISDDCAIVVLRRTR